MSGLRAEVLPWSVAPARPPSNANRAWPRRDGLLLRLTDDSGRTGQGEASPLPGYSRETLDDCRIALLRIAAAPPPALDPALRIEPQLRARLDAITTSAPAARFAVESALLDLAAKAAAVPLAEILASITRGDPRRPLAVSALVDATEVTEVIACAEAAIARGIRTVKLKVGRPGAQSSELKAIAALRHRFGDALAIRVDVNGALGFAEAKGLVSSLSPFSLEFVEEPVTRGQLASFAASADHGVPIAADESLQDPGSWNLLSPAFASGALRVAVLKPMALGGALACIDLAARVRAVGGETVVTHLFDSPVALAAASALAFALPSRRFACGLDRHAVIDAWPGAESASFVGGALVPPTESGLGIPLVSPP